MKAKAKTEFAEENGSGSQPVRRSGRAEVLPDGAGAALSRFLLPSLSAVGDVIEQSLCLQQQMMDVISQQVFESGGTNRSDMTSEVTQQVVTAMQADDLIRQNYENLIRAIVEMSKAVEEVHGSAASGPDASDPASQLRRRWSTDLLNALQLDDMRQCFARRLNAPDGT